MGKEIGVLYSTMMVLAHLKNWKLVTRRDTGLKEINKEPDKWKLSNLMIDNHKQCYSALFKHKETGAEQIVNCRYGVPGDIIKQRENFYAYGRWVYGFDKEKGRDAWRFVDEEAGYHYADNPPEGIGQKRVEGISTWWLRPSLYIPDAAVRLRFEVVSITCERLMDITEHDAMREGVDRLPLSSGFKFRDYLATDQWFIGTDAAKLSFLTLWDKINGAGSSLKNNWVFAVKYKNI